MEHTWRHHLEYQRDIVSMGHKPLQPDELNYME